MIIKQQKAKGSTAIRQAIDSVRGQDAIIYEEVTQQTINDVMRELKAALASKGKGSLVLLTR